MYLNVHSCYSLRYGVLSPEQIVAAAVLRGITALALTDINNTSCTFEFVVRCREAGIRPVLGIEFRRDGRLLYVGLARSDEGFAGLCRFLSECSLDGHPLPDTPPEMEGTYIIYPHAVRSPEKLRPHEYIGIRPNAVNALFRSPLRRHPDKLVAWVPVTFLDRDGYRTHKLLRAIDTNQIIGKLAPDQHAAEDERFFFPSELATLYAGCPELLTRAAGLLDQCHTDMQADARHNRQTFAGSTRDDLQLLHKLALGGLHRRYGPDNKEAAGRVRRELDVIEKMHFAPYFLITWDIIRYARSAGFFHVGRGSGANSIVAYCLGITDVDPIELDLYFERFINPYRSSPPDFDIDFSWDERDDVTDYIFKRYGRGYTALLATYNTFKGRSIIRELGKVFGLPKDDIDRIVDEPLAVDKHHPYARHIFHFGKQLDGLPNYLSIHAGGILIGERPLYAHTALQMMPKGFPVTHFDMHHAEDLGYHKYDVLSQRGLGHIKEAVDLVRANRGVSVDIHDIPRIKEDERVRTQLRSGQCIGCFYIESPAMRGLLSKLKCDNYVHLVAASSIIRPGVAQSGMMREYIQRFHHPHDFQYIHPVFREHLGETFGVMVYQEDVMKVVHHFAGLDLDESDVLRRVMTGKKKSSAAFARLRQKYFDNCGARGYPEALTQEVWRQIESFSGYSFCKAHSASYAVESFQSLWLKAWYPLEFMVAVINNFGGFYRTEIYVHEARMQGARIHPPCVNRSRWLTSIRGEDVYLGFVHLQGLERQLALDFITERERGGPFRDLADFCRRVPADPSQLDLLIRISAFRFTGQSKYELLWERGAVG
ncbi:MAG: DNA polymerase III subunit alpha [Saprospiraceae bacterium]|nr:DNA polymerase III subunit alpha [Saprospiraceae bacterium]